MDNKEALSSLLSGMIEGAYKLGISMAVRGMDDGLCKRSDAAECQLKAYKIAVIDSVLVFVEPKQEKGDE